MENQHQIEFLEKEIKNGFSVIRNTAHLLYESNYSSDRYDKEEIEFTKEATWERFQILYSQICVYLELLNLHSYLKEFKIKYNSLIYDRDRTIHFEPFLFDSGHDSDQDFQLIFEWSVFLSPFLFYANERPTEYNKLVDFLKNTNEILKFCNVVPKFETDINRCIRKVLEFYFDDVISFSAGFFHNTFQDYRPDIIIKGINTAVEYKLIRTHKEISKYFDQIIVDAKRYIGNSINKYCIAVLCVDKNLSITKKSMVSEWKKLHFPDRWELVIIQDVNCKSVTKISRNQSPKAKHVKAAVR